MRGKITSIILIGLIVVISMLTAMGENYELNANNIEGMEKKG